MFTIKTNVYILILFSFLVACKSNSKSGISFADNSVVAHRGAWKADDLPSNSIASLRKAIELGCTGSEFDVRMTADDILIVTHDADYFDMPVEETTYAELSKVKLPNGEILPTLKEYVLAGIKNNDSTGLVCEIKPCKNKERNPIIAQKVLELVDELGAHEYVLSYISFSYKILEEIEKIRPAAVTQYLDGSAQPSKLKEDGIDGLDYHYSKLTNKPQWISEAKEKDLILNAWTVNEVKDIDWAIVHGFDYITTDEPEIAFERIAASPLNKGYNLVWSDEFNYKGLPDHTKWSFEKGFIRNVEKQYYVDQMKNAKVDSGMLSLKVYKEKVPNAAFESKENKDWKKNQGFADYSSSSIETKDIEEWTYGYIEIRAKLPEGRGLWPALWMLGHNFEEVGWPKCGEIDIMEHVGFERDSIFGTIHTKAYNHMKRTEKGKKAFIDKPYESFHLFAIEWTPDKMDFLLDNKVYNHIENEYKTSDEWPFDQDFYLKLNIAVGGMLGGQKGIDDNSFPAQMLVDYVRVFQKDEYKN